MLENADAQKRGCSKIQMLENADAQILAVLVAGCGVLCFIGTSIFYLHVFARARSCIKWKRPVNVQDHRSLRVPLFAHSCMNVFCGGVLRMGGPTAAPCPTLTGDPHFTVVFRSVCEWLFVVPFSLWWCPLKQKFHCVQNLFVYRYKGDINTLLWTKEIYPARGFNFDSN